ncbi:hypothetical protein L1D19_24460 [Vibrio natriegens]|uniref:FtsK/SpoIIIE domain-containing protein n=1 Tax=Vibrio natriegens TaxID=691 RepID=UPI001EFC2FA0|nr:hypothetical protein [Vibrio natriegens]
MIYSKGCERVIAETVFQIIEKSFSSQGDISHKCFRVKNLLKNEILQFVNVWAELSPETNIQNTKVIIASDSDDDYPDEFKAEKDKSITWYRNNNESGLIYLETKTESDEQGLKNIFTLQDRNFLDDFFENLNIPQIIIERCWYITASGEKALPSLLTSKLIEVLKNLHPNVTQVPVRNFIRFVLSCCKSYQSQGASLTDEQQDKLIGTGLVHLGLFPDEYWNIESSMPRTSRRLELNLSYAELATTNNVDIEPEDVAKICSSISFKNSDGTELASEEQQRWKELCVEYSKSRDRNIRELIPFRIFEQLFAKDVKGLQLGDRVERELEANSLEALEKFYELKVQDGLNNRVQESALVLLDADTSKSGLPLVDSISKQTKRMVEKVAYPTPEKFVNPLTKLAEIARDFYTSYSDTPCKIELRLGKGGDSQAPATGLFSFVYGATLKSTIEGSLLNTGGFELSAEDCLLYPSAPPKLSQDNDDVEYDEAIRWSAIPLEFALIRIEDGVELDVAGNYEWLPDYYPYLALFWIRIFDLEPLDFYHSIKIPAEIAQDDWLTNICNRTLSLADCLDKLEPTQSISNYILTEVSEQSAAFCESVRKQGLSIEIINELLDKWAYVLEQAKQELVPDGNTDQSLQMLLSREIVEVSSSDKLLMLPSHPIRLRWISEYLKESERNANLALAGKLRLNEKNDKLYIKWLSDLSPHQQPPIAATKNRKLLFASGELGWCEEFTPIGDRQKVSKVSKGEILDYASISEMAFQVKTYLEAHPYKQDGLKILLVIQKRGQLAAELIKEIRKGDQKSAKMTIHVIAPSGLWEEVIANFEKLPTENRISEGNQLFPPLQLRLYTLERGSSLQNTLGEQSFDIALVPGLLGEQFTIQHNTEPEGQRLGKFDPLLDSSSCIYGGQQGGEISVSMMPRDADSMLNDWSTLSVRHERAVPVSKLQPENTDFVELKISFQDTAKLYEELHNLSHWVILLERYLRREQVESLEPQPDILTVRDKVGTSGLHTLIVSSNSGRKFIVNRLKRKLKNITSNGRVELSDEKAEQLALKIYDETRKISPQLALKAMGISRVTEEILGLMIAMHIADLYFPTRVQDGIVVWLSLDEHPEWFSGTNTTRADLCRITLEKKGDSLAVDVLVVEGKFRQSYDSHGIEQVKTSLELFKSIITSHGEEEAIDSRLWREHLLSAMENVNPDARVCFGSCSSESPNDRYGLSKEIREDFRNGNYTLRDISGLFSICCYLDEGSLSQPKLEGDVHVVKSFKDQVFTLVAGKNTRLGVTSKNTSTSLSITSELPALDSKITVLEEKRHEADKKSDGQSKGHLSLDELITRYQTVLDKFGEFGISVEQPEDESMRFVEGPASILYRVKPGQAVEPKKLFEKADVLKLALALDQDQNIRFGNHKGYVTIDVPKNQEDRYFVDAESMWSRWERPEYELASPLGEDSFGNIVDLNFSSSNSPHLLIGGTTGSGKSEALNTILDGMVRYYSEHELRLMLVDPKGTELQHYEDSKHLEGTIGWDDSDAVSLLEQAVVEMQERYAKLKSKRTRSLPEYNKKVSDAERIPWWVVVLDEYADLTSDKDSKKVIEGYLKRLAQKARAAGIHVIIATQKPSAEVISTNLRSNLPTQLALRVKSSTESRVIIDEAGAETLNGKGDALLKAEGKLTRIQCAKA